MNPTHVDSTMHSAAPLLAAAGDGILHGPAATGPEPADDRLGPDLDLIETSRGLTYRHGAYGFEDVR